MKFDGYISFFFRGGGGGTAYSYCIKKGRKMKKERKKNQVKVFKRVTSDKRFGSLFPFCIQNKSKITTS